MPRQSRGSKVGKKSNPRKGPTKKRNVGAKKGGKRKGQGNPNKINITTGGRKSVKYRDSSGEIKKQRVSGPTTIYKTGAPKDDKGGAAGVRGKKKKDSSKT